MRLGSRIVDQRLLRNDEVAVQGNGTADFSTMIPEGIVLLVEDVGVKQMLVH